MTTDEPRLLSQQVSGEVRAWMGRRSIRQQELADGMGLSRQAVSSRLSGNTAWSVDDMAAAARVLGVEVSDLLPPAAAR